MIDPDGESDESVLYTGTFLSYTDSAKKTMTAQQEELTIQYSKEIAALQVANSNLNARIAELETALEEANVSITALTTSNEELSNEVATLNEELGSTEAELKLQTAKLAQKNAEATAKKYQQIEAQKQKAKTAASNAVKKRYFKQAATNMQKFSLGSTPITNNTNKSTVVGGTGLSQSSGSNYNAGGYASGGSGGFIND
jgi:chromosome segregation ATPase